MLKFQEALVIVVKAVEANRLSVIKLGRPVKSFRKKNKFSSDHSSNFRTFHSLVAEYNILANKQEAIYEVTQSHQQ